MPYTSRDEITTAIEDCVKDGLTHHIDPDRYVPPHTLSAADGKRSLQTGTSPQQKSRDI
jgi:hypothetical protein